MKNISTMLSRADKARVNQAKMIAKNDELVKNRNKWLDARNEAVNVVIAFFQGIFDTAEVSGHSSRSCEEVFCKSGWRKAGAISANGASTKRRS